MTKILFTLLILTIILQGADLNKAFADSNGALPVPARRPHYNSNYFYFFTSPESPAPILDNVKGMSHLPGDTLIRFKILPDSEGGNGTLVSFETVPTHGDDPIIKGQIPYQFLGEEVGQRPTIENLRRYQTAIKTYSELERKKRIEKESTMSIEEALKEFHETYCANKGQARSEAALKAKWDSFIKNAMLTPRGRQLAQNAKTLDLVSRTIMYEAQRQNQIGKNAHSKAEACQWDIIALSIKNRAFSPKVKAYGGSYHGDINGVATDSQYNVWMKSKVRKNRNLLACYLHSKHTHKKGGPRRKKLFEGITKQIKSTLINSDDEKPTNHDVSGRFTVTNPNRKPAPQLSDMTHYYHPGGMGRCNIKQRISPKVANGILRLTRKPSHNSANFKYYIPIVNGRVLGHKNLQVAKAEKREVTHIDPHTETEWGISLYKKIKGRWQKVSVEDVFGAEATLIDTTKYDENYPVNHYACLPRGVLPQCFEGKGLSANQLSATGVRVPYTWFNKSLRAEMEASLKRLGFNTAEHNFTLPQRFAHANPAGVPIGIKCTSQGMTDDSRPNWFKQPSFGGDCDSNIVMASGVDQDMPFIINPPIPTFRPDPDDVETDI